MNDRELRDAYATVLRDRHPDRKACPAPERLRVLAERVGPETDRLETLDHVMACANCRAEFDLLRALAETRPAPLKRWSTPLAAAAGITFLVAAGLLWRGVAPAGSEAALRGDAELTQLIAPNGSLEGAAPRFIWRSAGAGARYRLEVFTPAGDPVFSMRLTDTTAVLPDSVRLQGGQAYHWWLVVETREGQEFRSGVATFRP
jgi:hypothetical protein